MLLASSLTGANISVTNNIIWGVAAYGYTGYTYRITVMELMLVPVPDIPSISIQYI